MRVFLRRVTYLSSANFLNGVLGIVFVPVAVSRLGPTGYGIFSVYAVIGGYVALLDLGVGKNLLRLLAADSDPARRRGHFQTVLGVYMTIAVTAIAVSPVAAYMVPRVVFPVPPEFVRGVQWVTLLAILEYVVGVPVSMMQVRCTADEQFERYSLFVMVSGLLRYSLSFTAVFVFARPESVVALIVARRFGDVIAARWILGPLPPGSWSARFRLRELAAMVRHSAILSLAQLLQVTVVSIGAVLVNYAFGLRSLGVYRAVFDLASKVWFFSNTVGYVVFPRFVRLFADPAGRERLGTLLPRVLRLSWMAYGLLAVAGIVIGPPVLSLMGMSGPDFRHLFVTVVGGVALNAHAGLAYEFVQATGRYRVVVMLAALSLGLMIAGFFAFAGTFGVAAIGWAWLMSQGAYGVVSDTVASHIVRGSTVGSGRGRTVRSATFSALVLCAIAATGLAETWAWYAAGVLGTAGLLAGLNDWADVARAFAYPTGG